MNKPNVSMFVPFFNIEGYIPFCVHSILNQDFKEYELLLINGGTTDNSRKICDFYAVKDNKIKIYHHDKLGTSAPRNLGLEKAKGELICFLDGNDDLYPGF